MGHHVILVGPPGVGKTTIAKNVAELLPPITVNDCNYHCDPGQPLCPHCKSNSVSTKTVEGADRFVRVQGSPDLTVEDLFGDIDPIKALEYGPLSQEAFTPGKIFKANNGVLFFDELNRCPEKLQNGLLQVLQENVATIGSYDVDLPADFIFIGTMNPEDSSTETLSDVFLDRVDIIYMSHPESSTIENQIVTTKGKTLDVNFDERLLHFMVEFLRELRASKQLEKVPSVRASISLYERSQSHAILAGRDDVSVDDIERAVYSVLAHRISMKPSVKYIQDPLNFLSAEFKEFKKRFQIEPENRGEGP